MKGKKAGKYLIILTVVLALLAIGFITLNMLVQKKIRQLTRISPAIQVTYSSLHTNIFTGNIFFDDLNINFIPYPSLPQKKHVVHFHHVAIKGINFFSSIFTKKISVGRIALEEGNIQPNQFLIDKRDSLQTKIFEDWQLPFTYISIHHFELTALQLGMQAESSGISIYVKELSAGDIKISRKGTIMPVTMKNLQAEHSSVSYHDEINKVVFQAGINIDGIEINPFSDSIHFSSINASLSGLHFSNKSRHHEISVETLALNSKQELISLHGIHIIPQYGRYGFGRKVGHQVDVIRASLSKIDIVQPDIRGIFRKEFTAKKILIGNGTAHVFRDRRLPRPQKISPLPVSFLKSIPIDIRVQTCELAPSTVIYEEYPSDGYGKTGILRLERMRVTLHSLINHPLPGDPAYMDMRASASIMGSGTANATIRMPLHKGEPYLIKGILEKVDLTKLNSSSENLGKIRIKTGFLDYLSFNFMMNDQRSTGKTIGAYHHLIIQQLKKNTSKKKVAGFPSFMLRHLIIPLNKDKSLPERKRTGNVDYKRDPTRFVSYYFLQSLLMGVKKSFTLGFLLPK